MKRNAVLALAALSVSIMLWGCSTSTGPAATTPTTAELIGKWILFSAHYRETSTMHFGIPGMKDSTMTFDTAITVTGTSNYAQLNADMTYSIQIPAMASITVFPYSDTGSWSLSGGTLRLISTFNDTTNYNASTNGNSGVFVNTISDLTNNPSGTLPGSYLQSTTMLTIYATKQ